MPIIGNKIKNLLWIIIISTVSFSTLFGQAEEKPVFYINTGLAVGNGLGFNLGLNYYITINILFNSVPHTWKEQYLLF